ncbi:hypothetical protein [Paraclostridium bifermentans]|uniref:hypothetical protein n=1 Tax=Paraclostridium bifermentans TaxID=1490 RepID=UPI00189C9680|nr:hypothetical protein [Paraclostridium bifermentans]
MLSKGMIMTIVGSMGIITTIIVFFIVYISTNNKIKAFINGDISSHDLEDRLENKINKYIPNNETEVLRGDSTVYIDGDSTVYMNEESTTYIKGDSTVYMD